MLKSLRSEEGLGLFTIQERLKFYEGKMAIQSLADRGARVKIEIPKTTSGNPQ